MPWFGSHLSIAGGLHNALLTAQRYGFRTVQFFSKNNNQWKAKPLTAEQTATFRATLRQTRLRYPTIHVSYLINLASPKDELHRKSIEAFIIEMERAEQLTAKYLVTHPGAFVDSDEETGLQRVVDALDEIHQRCPEHKVQILLETTAGQGTSLGHRFEHLAEILRKVRQPERLGICFDTCHVFAAGYPLAPRKEYLATMRSFEKLIGTKRIRAFHLNDSRKAFGSRVDRHHHLGEGHLGFEPFRLLVNDARFRARPMILETPKEEIDGQDMDVVNHELLKSWLKK